jgi:ribonuclease Z
MFAITILGNNSALPMHDRHPTSQIVSVDESVFLVDCGEGAQIQMNRFKIRRSRIGHIFISHMHGDHYFGLPGLLNSFSLTSRTEDLHLYGPPALKEILDLQFSAANAVLSYPLHFHPLTQPGMLLEEKKVLVSCFPVTHRIECWGFLFREKERQRKVDPEKAIEHGVPSSFFSKLKEGLDYVTKEGDTVKNEWVTKPPPHARSYAYCADTLYEEKILPSISGADLIYHEATYLDNMQEIAASRFHSTAKQAAMIAQKAGVKKLLLGHFSSKYEDLNLFYEEAAKVFPNTDLAREGVTYLI